MCSDVRDAADTYWATLQERFERLRSRNQGEVSNGMAARVDRIKAIGNGQVSLVAATIFNRLKARL
jgi:hypothetical protein